MACKLKRDNNNNVIGIETPGGESSLLFDNLLNATGDPAVAEYVYRNMYTKEFKDDYGMDFENDAKAKNPATLITDKNGEPILAMGNGYYYVIRPDGTEKILTNSKGEPLTFSTTQTASNLSYEKEKVVVEDSQNLTRAYDVIKEASRKFKELVEGKGNVKGNLEILKTCVLVLSFANSSLNLLSKFCCLFIEFISIKSITIIPPISLNLSCLAISSDASKLFLYTVSFNITSCSQ